MIRIYVIFIVLIVVPNFMIQKTESCRSSSSDSGNKKSYAASCTQNIECGTGLMCSSGKCKCAYGAWSSYSSVCCKINKSTIKNLAIKYINFFSTLGNGSR